MSEQTYKDNSDGADWKPRPDPSVLTTQQLVREIASLKEVIFTRLDGMDRAILLFNENITRVPTETQRAVATLKELLEVRLDAMDKAIVISRTFPDRLPALMDEKIAALHDVFQEKFDSIRLRFQERDVRTEQTAKDAKVGVDTALSAAKEAFYEQNKSSALAILKSENATSKALDGLSSLIHTSAKSVDDRFNDMKSRSEKLSDQFASITAAFMSRSEVEARISTTTDKLSDIGDRLNRNDGKGSGINASWGYLLGALSVIVLIGTLVVEFIRK
jgi:hypothetical protein